MTEFCDDRMPTGTEHHRAGELRVLLQTHWKAVGCPGLTGKLARRGWGGRIVYREWKSKRARESESEGGLDKDCEQARTEGGSGKTTDRMPTEE